MFVSTVFGALALINGWDYQYNDITELRGRDFDYCREACRNTQECEGFVMNRERYGCWLKNEFGQGVQNQARDTFVRGPDFDKYKPYYDVDIQYGDLYERPNMPFKLCAQECSQNYYCRAFVFNRPRGRGCWFKSQIGNGNRDYNRQVFVKVQFRGKQVKELQIVEEMDQ